MSEVFTGRCPAETGVRKVPIVICRTKHAKARFAALLVPVDPTESENARPRLSRKAEGEYLVEQKGRRDFVSFGANDLKWRRNESGRIKNEYMFEIRDRTP
jgi:hypothetical protein